MCFSEAVDGCPGGFERINAKPDALGSASRSGELFG